MHLPSKTVKAERWLLGLIRRTVLALLKCKALCWLGVEHREGMGEGLRLLVDGYLLVGLLEMLVRLRVLVGSGCLIHMTWILLQLQALLIKQQTLQTHGHQLETAPLFLTVILQIF